MVTLQKLPTSHRSAGAKHPSIPPLVTRPIPLRNRESAFEQYCSELDPSSPWSWKDPTGQVLKKFFPTPDGAPSNVLDQPLGFGILAGFFVKALTACSEEDPPWTVRPSLVPPDGTSDVLSWSASDTTWRMRSIAKIEKNFEGVKRTCFFEKKRRLDEAMSSDDGSMAPQRDEWDEMTTYEHPAGRGTFQGACGTLPATWASGS